MGTTASPNNLMTMAAGTSLIGGASSLASSIAQAGAQKAQGAWERQQHEFNAKVADLQAIDAIRRGDKAAGQVRAQGRRVKGAQRAAFAAQGIDPNTGTAMELQDETDLFSELDAVTVKSNAFREAFGYKVDALSSRGRGQRAESAAKFSSGMTIASGGLAALQYGLQAAQFGNERRWDRT